MRKTLILAGLFLLLSTLQVQAFMGFFGDSIEKTTAKDGMVTIDTSAIANGQSKHYSYTEAGTTVRFFLVRDAQGVLRAAFDACDVCWQSDKGYKLQEGVMVCINCGMQFPLSRIGAVKGGCNPHPMLYNLDGNTFTITTQELLAGSAYFPGNR